MTKHKVLAKKKKAAAKKPAAPSTKGAAKVSYPAPKKGFGPFE